MYDSKYTVYIYFAYEKDEPKKIKATELLNRKTSIYIGVCLILTSQFFFLLKDVIKNKLFLTETKQREDNFRIYS